MSGDDHSTTEPALIKACYIISCLAYLVVTANSILVMTIMIKHRTFCDTDWRVKTVLVAYPLFATFFCLNTLISRIFKFEID